MKTMMFLAYIKCFVKQVIKKNVVYLLICIAEPTRKLQKQHPSQKGYNYYFMTCITFYSKQGKYLLSTEFFWRRYTPDVLSTRIRKLSPQTKKVKSQWIR